MSKARDAYYNDRAEMELYFEGMENVVTDYVNELEQKLKASDAVLSEVRALHKYKPKMYDCTVANHAHADMIYDDSGEYIRFDSVMRILSEHFR